jgi:hypothetical protein
MAPKYSTDMFSSTSKLRKAVMYLMEKIHVSHKLGAGIGYGVIGHEFNVNESKIYVSINRNSHDENVLTRVF